MQWVKISNRGEIEAGALTLLGASSKRDEPEKIGYFGTGLKYAIAYFLRNDIPLKVFSGEEEILIESRLQTFRGQTFDVIHVNGQPTSITTATGRDWECWQAFREVYCNALDEPEHTMEIVEEDMAGKGAPGRTCIYIGATGAVRDIISTDRFGKYFATNAEVVYETPTKNAQILTKLGREANVFRKGVRVWETTWDSMYDYNFQEIDISEDRTAKYNFEVYQQVTQVLCACDNPEVVSNVLAILTNEDYLEFQAFHGWSVGYHFNKRGWVPALRGKLIATPHHIAAFMDEKEKAEALWLPDTVFNWIRTTLAGTNSFRLPHVFSGGEVKDWVSVDVDGSTQGLLTTALNTLSNAGYSITYNIKVVRFQKDSTLGSIDKAHQQILVSREAIHRPLRDLCITLIEEQIHLKFGVKDYTREFMDYVLREMVHTLIPTTTTTEQPK